MLQKLTALVVRHPAVVVVGIAVAVAATAAVVGDTVTGVDAVTAVDATLGSENGTVETQDGVGWTGPPEVGDGDGS
jgi:hypothetical protein